MTYICVSKVTIIVSENGLSPVRRQAIIWTNAGILLIGPLRKNFSEILIGIETFSFRKMHFKMSSGKWLPLCLGFNVITYRPSTAKPHCRPINQVLTLRLTIFSLSDIVRLQTWNPVLVWGLQGQFPPFRYFPNLSVLSKHMLAIEYHVYIWQVSPQLSCGGTCQI